MAKSRRKTRYTVSRFRGRQEAASGRRFYMVWINRMVNKQVEKQIAKLRKEIILMNLELRVQMAAELKEHLGAAVETPKPYSASDTEEMETRQLKEEKEKSRVKKDSNCNQSETQSFQMPHPNHFLPKPDQGSSMFLSISSESDSGNRDIRDTEIKHFSGEDPDPSQQAQCGLISPSGDPSVYDSCKQMEKSEEKNSSQNPFQMFSEEESVGDKVKAEEDVLMKAQWKEWLDKQEMKGNKRHEHQRNVQQRAISPGASEEQRMKAKKCGQTSTVKKIKTYLSDFF